MKKLMTFCLLIIPALVLTACYEKNKSDATAVTINQILNNSTNSIQSNGLYLFNKNKLNVLITFSPFQNPDLEPVDSDFKKAYQKDFDEFNKTFPENKLKEQDYHSEFEEEFKHVTFKLDKKAGKVILSGTGIEKSFSISDSNENRLIDNLGNEYEMIIDKK